MLIATPSIGISPDETVVRKSSTSSRLEYGDLIRVLGTIAVVLGHVCDRAFIEADQTNPHWYLAGLMDLMCRWAVPAYIMLSGAIFLQPSQSDSASFYRKRLNRLGIPLLFWTVLYIVYSVEWAGYRTWSQALVSLAQGEPYGHLHFMFRLAGLYAITPLLRVFTRHASRDMVRNTVIGFLALGAADSIINCTMGTTLNVFVRFVPFIGYYLAGWWLRDLKPDARLAFRALMVLISAGLLMWIGTTILVHFFELKPPPSVGLMLLDFLSPLRIIQALSAWVVLIYLVRQPSPLFRTGLLADLINRLVPLTLGIYLVHPLFLSLLDLSHHRLHLWPLPSINVWPNGWLGIPLTAVCGYLLSLATVILLQHIPGVCHLVGTDSHAGRRSAQGNPVHRNSDVHNAARSQ